ncbi:MAG: tyrosine-type recombinase/integrase [Chloroflexi bacterium]|nr:tyrosine-type recombinase/integrase [Chloroflexota bacterium]
METTLQNFRDWLEKQDSSPRTVSAYTADLAHFARWFTQTNGVPLTPEMVTPTDVREYRQWMQAVRGLAPATINRRIASLRAYATWARSTGLIAGDPTEGVKLVDEQRKPPRWLDNRQQAALNRTIQRLLEYAELKARLAELEERPAPPELIWARRDVALVHLMLNAGLRVDEVRKLNVEHILLRERSSKVTVMGKGNKQRTVPLNTKVRAALSDWIKVRPETNSPALFINRRGKRLGTRMMQRIVTKLGNNANLEDLTPHVLRHSFAKNLVNSKTGLEQVADLLGHSRLDTTRIYTRPGQQDLARAVESIVAR